VIVNVKGALSDPLLTSSVALEAVKKLLGPTVLAWEPETIRLELTRRGITVDDGVMAKILSAITIVTTRAWTADHDVLFAFAVACCGVPADAEALHHPTPEQLCWAIHEIAALVGAAVNDDEGFDPDTVDPAIAVVLHDEGFMVTPDELRFAQDALDRSNRYSLDAGLKKRVLDAWKKLATLPVNELRKELAKLDEDPYGVQLRRLGDCRLYVAEHEERRAKQHGLLNG
jgi:hypothetical protein